MTPFLTQKLRKLFKQVKENNIKEDKLRRQVKMKNFEGFRGEKEGKRERRKVSVCDYLFCQPLG